MNDLLFQDLLAALPPNSVFIDASRGICINVSLVSNESPILSQLTQAGVVEFCYKLLDAASRAQKTKNTSLPTGQKLNSFSDPVWSTPNSSGNVVARHSVSAQFLVNTSTASAPLA